MRISEADLAEWVEQLQAYLFSRMGLYEMSREIAQEAATRLIRALRQGKEIEHGRGWMFRVGRNLAIDELRRNLPMNIGLEWEEKVTDPVTEVESEVVVPVGGMEVPRRDLLKMIPNAVQCLPGNDRDYLDSYYGEGSSFEDLAEREGATISTVKGRLYRARRRLRQVLTQQVRERGPEWS